ncbi:hypothetical protein M431DRAFT_398984 [Trichoderma harzianum CBS 226.95]|uniref:Secreted protein n=1 Tax=Trichoderma harzianum CBS 226.95 TaxID=983964 RepID=A0A2T4AEB2_TRIHA|nr:hypothetical protein M431DRAFT_398984 [Trichoderma harzianum CBS 226.95]PTB55353.1 hypothetical protein M431DRAFT_398984 [Trichoderma harzianum CBS 226.95]
MARLRTCQTLCVCWFMGVTRRTLSCLLVDKVSIERPKMLHLPGLGARTTLDQSTRERVHGHTCHLGNSRTRLALSISLVHSLSRAALLLHMHERTYTRTIKRWRTKKMARVLKRTRSTYWRGQGLSRHLTSVHGVPMQQLCSHAPERPIWDDSLPGASTPW